MAIIKESTFPAMGPDGEPLVRLLDSLPSGNGMEKTAGIHPEILAYKQQLEPEPGKTYVHILALGAGDYYGANLNNDHFPWDGLQHDHTKTAHPYMHGYKTFLNAHAFAHHVNKDPEKAYGDVLVSVLNHKMKRVELIVAIDEEKCIRNGGQRTLEKIKAGEYPSTSMGCRVPFDVCSICGHKAKYRSEYCDHMRNDAGKIMADGRKIFVYNPYPRFFDISFVFIGADRTSFVLEKVAMDLGAIGSAIGGQAVKGLTTKAVAKNALSAGAGAVGSAAKTVGNTVGNFKGTTGMLVGGAVGGMHGAMSAEDDTRDYGFMRGALGGALVGGLGNKFLRSSSPMTGAANLAVMGGGGSIATNALMPTMPAQTSSLDQMPKVATDIGKLNKLLRKSSGTVQPFMGMRVKRKVARQQRLKARPVTFAKLGRGEKASATSKLQELAFDPLPLITMDVPMDMTGNVQQGYTTTRINDKSVEKVAALKSATVTKLSDIFKDVTSTPMGRAVPMEPGAEPDIPCDVIDRMARRDDLGQSLSGLASAGVVLKPQEFQRAVLVRSGLSDMADDLHSRGVVFPEHAPVSRSMRIVIRGDDSQMIPSGILDLIQNILSQRSALTPLMLRRPMHNPTPTRIIRVQFGAHPMLDKVASLYNGYREDVLLNAERMVKSAMITPALMSTIDEARGFHDEKGPAFEAMMQMPMAYFSHAYWNRCCCDRGLSDKEFADKFADENPQIARYIAQQVASSCTMK